MIRPLRQRHRHIFLALGFFLPVVFVLGVVARKPFPSMDPLSNSLIATPQKVFAAEWERTDLFVKLPIKVRFLHEEVDTNCFAVEFSTVRDYFIKADLMVYWVAGNPPINDKMPDVSRLLGRFDSGALPLPSEAATNSGVLVLYSLADNEIVDVSKPILFRQKNK